MTGSPKWPSVTYETLRWVISPGEQTSRRQRINQTGTYEAAIVPKIAKVPTIPVSPAAATALEDASLEIARFDSEAGHVLVPFTSLLLRSESAASSRIENLTASAKAIALADLGDTTRQNATLIVSNAHAMQAAIALADQLNADAIREMHHALMSTTDPDAAGKWRDQQVWIGGSNFGPRGALFVPPKHQRIASAIADLVAFMKRDDLPVLAQAVIAHAQFETIHPFADGNGRTGRALLQAILRAKELTRHVAIPISAGLLTDTEQYFAALTAYRNGEVETLILKFCEASLGAVRNARKLVDDIEDIRNSWNDKVAVRSGASAWRLLNALLEQPIVDSRYVQHALEVSAPSADKAITHLCDVGILKQVSDGRRSRRWAANDVLRALDSFATRAGRRG